jgi:regulatory protein
MRSRHELEIRLRQKRIPAEIAAVVLDRLTEVGLIDDEAYARVFVAARQRTKPRGAKGLSSELARRGVAREIIDKVLGDLGEAEDPLDAARRAVAPKLRSLAAKPPAEMRRKAEQFLLRRGFSYGVAREVLDELIKDAGEE